MEKPIKCVVELSLVDMTLVQIVVAMWKHVNLMDSLRECLRSAGDLRSSNREVFHNIASGITENMKQLKLPEHFQKKIMFFITFIESEIRRTVDFHCSYLVSLLNQSDINLPVDFCFTPHGIIDRKKTSEIMVKDKCFDVYQRYTLACIYCLRDDILKLWNEMPEDCQESIIKRYILNDELYQKEGFADEFDEKEDCGEVYDEEEDFGEEYDEEVVTLEEHDEEEAFEEDFREEHQEEGINREGCDEEISQEDELLHKAFLEDNYADLEEKLLNLCDNEEKYTRNMVCLWTLAIKKEQLEFTLSFPYMLNLLQCSARVKNKAAFEYFLYGLKEQSSVKRELINAAKYIYRIEPDPDMLCFLLSKMTEEQQLEVFKDDPCAVLECFLKWPFLTIFMEIADRTWDFLSSEGYKRLLRAIIDYSTEFFVEFWQVCPTDVKRCIINKDYIPVFLTNEKDLKNAGIILRGTSAIEKIELTDCDRIRTLCKYFLSLHDWSSMKFVIKTYLFENTWRSQTLKFKEDFEKHIMSTNLNKDFVTYKLKWDQIFKELLSN